MSRRETLSESQRRNKVAEREARAQKRESVRSDILQRHPTFYILPTVAPIARIDYTDSDAEEDMADVPSPFFGLHSEDAETWFRSVEWWLQTKRAADDRARIGHVAGLLKNGAQTWFHSLIFAGVDAPTPDAGLRTFADFKEAFQVRYHRDVTNEWRQQAALWAMKQEPNQTVEDFIAAVEAKAVAARATAEQIKGAVINGLRPDLRAAVLNHDINTLEDVKKWALVAEGLTATPSTTPIDVALALRKLEDSMNLKFEQIQLRALGDESQPARRQTSPAPAPSDRFYPERQRDHTPARDWSRENRRYYAAPPSPPSQRGQRRGEERQRYPTPPPARYQQRREEPRHYQHQPPQEPRHYPPSHPPPHRYEQVYHPARREEQRYMGPNGAARGGRQIQGAHNVFDFECCGRCGVNHGPDDCRAINLRCKRCLLIGHFARKCVTRVPQGRHFEA